MCIHLVADPYLKTEKKPSALAANWSQLKTTKGPITRAVWLIHIVRGIHY